MFSWCSLEARKPILVRLTMGIILGFGSAEQELGEIFGTITVDRNLSYVFLPVCHIGKHCCQFYLGRSQGLRNTVL